MKPLPVLVCAAAIFVGCGQAAAPVAGGRPAGFGTQAARKQSEDRPKQLSIKVPEGLGPEAKPLPDRSGPYTLRLKLTPGDVIEYEFRNRSASVATPNLDKGKVPGGTWEDASMELDGTQKLRVVEFKDGYYKIDRETKNVRATGTGFGKDQAREMTRSAKPFKDSVRLSERHSYPAAQELADPFTNGLNGVFPEGPVKVGDTWEFDAFRNGTKTRADARGVEEVQGVKCLLVELKFPPLVEGADDRMWVWFELRSGVVEKAVLRSVSDQYGIDTYTVHSQWRRR